jgi:2-polyprenyl-6-methoxyphenol hydroxylase-like FAD-dependent oxidoreductase
MTPETDVLIAGGGPTGLVLALWLHKQGVKFRIVDLGTGPATNSRALVVHARILELYRQLDLAEDLVKLGYKLPATNVWVEGQHRARISLRDFGKELTPYPYMLTVPQDVHERALEGKLNSYGIFVERRTKLESFVDNGRSITAKLIRQDDETEMICEASYIVGCEGAHSIVRQGIGAKYGGDTYVPMFYIVDLEAEEQASPFFNGEAHLSFVEDTFNLILPYAQERRVRLIGTTISKTNETQQNHNLSEPHPKIMFEDVLPDIKKASRIEPTKVHWFSPYRSHHRISSLYHKNRAFIVGDAAHIHSPVGGQGMNTGIMDAINLAWKLATVITQKSMTEEAKTCLLNSYEPERRVFALSVIGATDRGFTFLTSRGLLSHMLRAWIIPYLAPILIRFQFARLEIFRRSSQLVCSYRSSPLNSEPRGSETIQPGDRVPWAKTASFDNFETLQHLCWQLHMYDGPQPELFEWCQRKNIRLVVFDWDKRCGDVGFKKDAAYLIRPDHYIAGIFDGYSVLSKLNGYFSTHGLICHPLSSD